MIGRARFECVAKAPTPKGFASSASACCNATLPTSPPATRRHSTRQMGR
jgi:hypothetical protein